MTVLKKHAKLIERVGDFEIGLELFDRVQNR